MKWLKRYRESTFLKIQAILCGWLLLLSFLIPHGNIERFMPELWKPIFPFQLFSFSDSMMLMALWVWRAVLVACVAVPMNVALLGLGFLLTFFCLGLQNCFGLEIQLFASLQLSFLFLFLFGWMSKGTDAFGRHLAFSMKLIIVLLFFSAGLSKLKWSGIGWAMEGDVRQYFQILYPINREVFGFDWVLKLRAALIESETLVRLGSVGVHAFELLIPLALFSRLASRVFLAAGFFFVGTVLLFLGINFFTILPLLVIWGLWDVQISEIFPKPERAWEKSSIAFPCLVVAQLMVTLFLGRNFWPVMANDMYARPIAKTPFVDSTMSGSSPLRDLTIEVLNRDGSSVPIMRNVAFAPFTKFHVFVALMKTRNEGARNALLQKVFLNYRDHTCTQNCDQAIGMVATKRSDVASTVLAKTITQQ